MMPESMSQNRQSDSMDSLISPSDINYPVDEKQMIRHRPDEGEFHSNGDGLIMLTS